MEIKSSLLTIIMIFFFTVHGEITVADLQGHWRNNFGNRFFVEDHAVSRNGRFWDNLHEDEQANTISVDGWVLDKGSDEFTWRKLNHNNAYWSRYDFGLLQSRIQEADAEHNRITLTQENCEDIRDMITLENFEDGDEILAFPHENTNVNKYHCFSQESLLTWINTNNGLCIHPILRRNYDVNRIIIGQFITGEFFDFDHDDTSNLLSEVTFSDTPDSDYNNGNYKI